MGQAASCVDQETPDPTNDTEGIVLKVSRQLIKLINRMLKILSRTKFCTDF